MNRSPRMPARDLRRTTAATALVLTASLVAACGGSGPADGGTGTAATELTVGIPTDINPANFLGVLSANEPVGRLVFESLVDYDTDAQQYVPWLAESWDLADDGSALTLTLREGLTFHTGRTVTAEDVVFSLEQAMEPDSGAQSGSLLKLASKISAPDERTVQLEFDEPVGESFLDALVWTRIIDPETFDGLLSGEEVVGTGPFMMTSWTPGSRVSLEKHDGYWNADEVAFDEVTLRVISQSQAMLAAIRSGEIDVAHRLVPRDVTTVADDPNIVVETFEPFAETYLGVDVTVEPFDDLRVRQALAHALDRDRIAEQVFSGYATATALPMPPSAPGVADADADVYPYDVETAKSLIEEAGASGATVTLAALSTDPILVAVRDIVQFNLEEIGLTVEPVSWDAAQVPENLGNGTTGGLWINRVSSGSLSPASMAATLLPYRPGQNASNVTDAEYEQLAKAAQSGAAEDNRAYTQYILDEAWHLTVVHTQNPLVVRKGVDGVTLDPNGYLDLVGASA